MKVISVQSSKCATTGTYIDTLILEYPRYIHAQLLTHRAFSKNSSSSRAVPIKSAISNIFENPAEYYWTSNQPGMQGVLIEDQNTIDRANTIMMDMRQAIVHGVQALGFPTSEGGLNIHKQDAARFLEPFQNIRVCLTSTEWANWEWLRVDKAAQPAIDQLANMIKQVRDLARESAMVLKQGEWHMPFVKRVRNSEGILEYFAEDGTPLSLEDAKMISMSSAAQTSYRKLDTTLEKAEDVYVKLFSGDKVHASPSEHQATPIGEVSGNVLDPDNWPTGVTHMDKFVSFWSGNFRNWIQHRQLIPNNAKYN